MSNKTNERRKGGKRTETGPRYESKNPGKGSNSTHVAKSRAKWKRRANRSERRTGLVTPKAHLKPLAREPIEDLSTGSEELGNCSLCGGEIQLLGVLGQLAHMRCRACGMSFSGRV